MADVSCPHFWQRWRSEYLLELRNAHRVVRRQSNGINVCVGDVVVIHEDGVQRGLWKLALVTDLVKSRDGEVRGAVVRCASDGGRFTEIRRPIQKLYPVELNDAPAGTPAGTQPDAAGTQPDAPGTQPDAPGTPADAIVAPVDSTLQQRPSRAAAQLANERRRQLVATGRV